MFSENKNFSFWKRIWDPRPFLANEWLEAAERYEERLRASSAVSPNVLQAILDERNRILELFNELLPEFTGRTSLVVTKDAHVEYCGVSLWKDRLYVLVSAALIARPFDCPQNSGVKAWQWLARHEASHIRRGHLPWLFHVRRLFRLTYHFCWVFAIILGIAVSKETMYAWLKPVLWLLGAIWVVQTVVCLCLEWKADVVATQSIKDPSILKEAEESICRMSKRRRFSFGWILYMFNSLLVDPHPPLFARRWLLRRRVSQLLN